MLVDPDRHARFAVLSAPDIPGVLVELGFLTHPREEALLAQSSHQNTLASAMQHAIDGYLTGLSRPTRRQG
jgi:N-acetylmuramoyl-L-alanine amidase